MAAKPEPISGPKTVSFAFVLFVFVFAFELAIATAASMDDQPYGMHLFQVSGHFVLLRHRVAKKTKCAVIGQFCPT